FEHDEHLVLDMMVVERARRAAGRHFGVARAKARQSDQRCNGRLAAVVEGAHSVANWGQVCDMDQWLTHPTLPSSEIEISFCVSTMNSIGRCCSTSRTKPLTMSATASSSFRPRCWQ